MQEPTQYEKFLFLDGHAIIYRAYHAFKELTDPTGKPINAVYGFAKILLKVINDYDPKYIAVAFDHKNGKSKRVADFEKYKAQRPPMPDDLISQVGIIKELVAAFNIPQFELDGFEADDLLGTISHSLAQAQNSNQNSADQNTADTQLLTIIVTGDKDILQLVVDNKTHVFIPGRGRFSRDMEYTQAGVLQKLGVAPQQIPDLKALMGDPSDNIPGVKGIGQKTATKLIQEFGSLESLYQAVEQITKPMGNQDIEKPTKPEKKNQKQTAQPTNELLNPVLKGSVLTKLVSDKEMAFLSQKLATIDCHAPVTFNLAACITKDYDKQKVFDLFDTYNFSSLKSLLPKDSFEQSIQEALF